MENGRVIGDVTELYYARHVRHMREVALPPVTATVHFADGAESVFPYAEVRQRIDDLSYRHGQALTIRANPDDAEALKTILESVRKQRAEESYPTTFKVRIHRKTKPSIRMQLAAGQERLETERRKIEGQLKGRTVLSL